MKHLNTLSLVTMLVLIPVSLSLWTGSFFNNRIDDIDRTRALRSRMQTQIHEAIHHRYPERILETRLRSRCGVTAYVVTMIDATGNTYRLYYDIDSGVQIRQDLLNGCADRVTGPGVVQPKPDTLRG